MRVARDLFEQPGRVPEVPDVELDTDGVVPDLLEELGGIAERVEDRPALDPHQLKWLDGPPQAPPLPPPRAPPPPEKGPGRPAAGGAAPPHARPRAPRGLPSHGRRGR